MARVSISKFRDTASLLREHTLPLAKEQGRFVTSGERGDFDIEISLSGLPEARREELVSALASNISDGKHGEKIGDGRMYIRAKMSGFSLAVTATSAIADFGHMLREAGLSDDELLGCDFNFQIKPSAEKLQVPTRRGLIPSTKNFQRRMAVRAHGLNVAAADSFDMGLRQRHGDRDYVVEGGLTGLNEAARTAILARLHEISETTSAPSEIKDGNLQLEAHTTKVGSGYGALLLAVRNMASAFEVANPTSTLSLAARFVGEAPPEVDTA